jgi:hypothetical protein
MWDLFALLWHSLTPPDLVKAYAHVITARAHLCSAALLLCTDDDDDERSANRAIAAVRGKPRVTPATGSPMIPAPAVSGISLMCHSPR